MNKHRTTFLRTPSGPPRNPTIILCFKEYNIYNKRYNHLFENPEGASEESYKYPLFQGSQNIIIQGL